MASAIEHHQNQEEQEEQQENTISLAIGTNRNHYKRCLN